MPKQEIKLNLPSPIQLIKDIRLEQRRIKLWLKREDLIHSEVSGNKWRKLEYNLVEMRQQEKKGILTFGGAFSNHIYATAAAGHHFNFKTIGIIRGERMEPLNPTLAYAATAGMKLQFVNRTSYRDQANLIRTFSSDYPDYYILPEGGSNSYALPGCAKIAEEINDQLIGYPDHICLSCGTGGTLAGLLTGLKGKSRVLGFSALKGDFHTQEIKSLLAQSNQKDYQNWSINTDYHFGGYAKLKPTLVEFIHTFKKQHQVQLEPIYTGKMMYGIFQLIEEGYFHKGSQIVAIHTGGLQGIRGMERLRGLKF